MVHELAGYERAAQSCRLRPEQLEAALFAPAPALFGHVAVRPGGDGPVPPPYGQLPDRPVPGSPATDTPVAVSTMSAVTAPGGPVPPPAVRPDGDTTGAAPDGDVIGFALWFRNFSTWEGVHGIYLEDLYVRPEARGTGAGRALLATLARICVERGYRRLEWWVLRWNPAREFYDALGAQPMEEWVPYRVQGEPLQELSMHAQPAPRF
jgi:GNAT superfamily N-acetyltransferase